MKFRSFLPTHPVYFLRILFILIESPRSCLGNTPTLSYYHRRVTMEALPAVVTYPKFERITLELRGTYRQKGYNEINGINFLTAKSK
jgi:hypothetical protein